MAPRLLQILLVKLISSSCFRARTSLLSRQPCSRCTRSRLQALGDNDDDNESLRKRIAEVQEEETRKEKLMLQRIADVRSGDEVEAALYAHDNVVKMPVVCYDGLLPKQCLELDTEDVTFSKFLKELGMGGLFVMVAFDHKRRKIRRHGVIVRIIAVDVARDARLPTAVHACLLGRARACVIGHPTDMVARVGRYRRGYGEDGERALGWGFEKFVEATSTHAADLKNMKIELPPSTPDYSLPSRRWTDLPVQLLLEPGETIPGVENLKLPEAQLESSTEEKAIGESLIASLERWQELASNPRTYDNVEVVAGSRARHGYPGLRVDPTRLLRNVLDSLGPMPSPSQPTALALWGAALVNPVPPLGVSPEMRAAILEAPTALRRLEMVSNGVRRSILNLEGSAPL